MKKVLWIIGLLLVVAGVVGAASYYLLPRTFENSSEHALLTVSLSAMDVPGALSAATAAVSKYPDSSKAYVGLAFAYAQSVTAGTASDGTRGEAAAQKAITLDPQNPDGYRALGYVYEVEGNLAQAIGAYTKGLSIYPAHPLLLSYRAHAEWLSGDTASAQTDYEHALALDPHLIHAELNVSDVYASIGTPDMLDKAASLLHRVVASDASRAEIAEAQSKLGTVLMLQGDYANAEKDFSSALVARPGSVHDELGVAWAEYYQLSSITTLTETDPRVGALMAHIANVQKNDPNSSSSYHVLGLLYYLVGDKAKGDAALTQAKSVVSLDTSLTEEGVAAMNTAFDAALKAAATKK